MIQIQSKDIRIDKDNIWKALNYAFKYILSNEYDWPRMKSDKDMLYVDTYVGGDFIRLREIWRRFRYCYQKYFRIRNTGLLNEYLLIIP